jgi:hypothetical protein
MMLHQDGSMHVWLAGQPALDLIVTLDDATSAIYSAFLIEECQIASNRDPLFASNRDPSEGCGSGLYM